jgi:pimeloyl-ACP methyl ester carboxylesterase
LGAKVQYFGDGPAALLGTLHHPQRLRARSAAVLLCNPFGEEAARAHRIYRVLATQLERAGFSTLRFDYSGTGDSLGDDDAATLDAWLSDIAAAGDELRAASGVKRLVVVGLRLGATLAALATSRRGLRPRHLILWDPIVRGAPYLRDLAAAHRSYMRDEIAGWVDRLPVSADGIPAEALGTPIAPPLAAQLGAIDLAGEPIAADLITVIHTQDGAGLDHLRAHLGEGPAVKWIAMAGSAAWNSDAALNAAIVPMDIVSAMVARIEETIP